MAFEVFTESKLRNSDFISVNESKTFGFPRLFLEKHGISGTEKVVILYDKDEKKVALYFTNQPAKIGYSFKKSKNPNHGGTVSARSFFDVKEIEAALYSQRYEYEVAEMKKLGFPEKPGSAFVIKLREKNIETNSEITKITEEVNNTSF